ncbi:HAMP domain-containing histidine kinase [Frankia sp. AiPs1]|uniref:sensor histidine kinase n=1 Tax=Frankia sp. AiPs1 TaxID=573493 RepID=UPI0020442150|nr:HAMP domain-containing sensor histidine kinase [Frankia sp. AiPs1]MCM3923560.1 HAMP domain-containing histidine kinase [Frankia sp. AiPs1]
MSRRILAAQLLLTAALLVGLCVPMGLDATRHDRALFGLRLSASTDAYVAEVKWRRLSPDAAPLPVPRRDSADVPPDELRLYRADNSPMADTGEDIPVTPQDLARAHHHSVTIEPSDANGHHMILVAPVSNANGLVGVLAVARSDYGLRGSINQRWTMIAVGGVLVALAALAISILLARWVSRPLRRLGHAAGELGTGDLTIRARAVGGPPEVREVAAAFDAMADRIQSLVDSQRHFLADVSHQIRTPLTAMRLRLELLEQDVDTTVAAEVAGTLVEVHRLSRMVDGLLAVSRAEHAPTAARPVPLAPVTTQRCLIWRPVAAAADIALTWDVDDAHVVASGPGHLEQILDNLLSNALEATPPGGRIRIESHSAPAPLAGPAIRLTVTDSGTGMSAEQRQAAFRRFGSAGVERGAGVERAGSDEPGQVADRDRTPRRADRRGHGLGLAIVHALVTADGGTIALVPAPTGGLCVMLDLPWASPQPGESAAAVPPQRSAAGHLRPPPELEFLEVVDDAHLDREAGREP